MSQQVPFNPLDKQNLGKSVAEALLFTPPIPLAELAEFGGVGIYALYYCGAFPTYKPISDRNKNGVFKLPIYVGSALPEGGRKGVQESAETRQSKKLYSRLSKHRGSVTEATNLDLSDFHCRFLLVDDIWIPLGESLLISWFSPLWNIRLDGFGNNDPGRGRYEQLRSTWDTVHPGRSWAMKCKGRTETQEQLLADIASYLRTAALP
ncbi:MAG: Eco29kI family restriction endonuclease [Desulfovibrio sp.]